MLVDKRLKIAEVLANNQTLQRLFVEFGIDYESVQNSLIKNSLIANDTLLQNNTVYNLAMNPSSNAAIAALNQSVSTEVGLYPTIIVSPHESHYRNYVSSKGTNYTYFLKWLYYTYKYFNEEQFFFNNLVNHYIPQYDAEIISSTTNLKIYYDGLGILLDTLDAKIEALYSVGDIDSIDDSLLQYIAQLLGYQKEDFSIQNISFRELIKNLVDIYKTKGTHYSFDLFFKLLGFDTEIREYYWDRDAQNPEEFGSVSPTNYLYYLTIQDPRIRTIQQTSLTSSPGPIQPINTRDWVNPKDLRLFAQLLINYSLEEVLGFKNSKIPAADRFTYFKTNFIQFKLKQFYTKQDLTAKDTETILKYVKFLTPIYVSAFVEVVTTPYEDFFEMSNPEAGTIELDGDPGLPPWVDILLPFLFVTIKDYIPLKLAPAPESAVVIANNSWTDLNMDGFADTALPIIFGNPAYGIQVVGTVDLSASKDLSINNTIGVKLDQGRGSKISIPGNAIQTYSQLLSALNSNFAANGLDVQASFVGTIPHLDIRATSNTTGPTSKILVVSGLSNDLFTSLSATPDIPVDGFSVQQGYQEFGLNFASGATLTGLSNTLTYVFYINVDITNYSEVDASGPVPTISSAQDIINAINNHYDLIRSSNFITSTNIEFISSDTTTDSKVALAYRDSGTTNGKLILVNSDGTIFRSGLNFTLYDCRNVALAATRDNLVRRFLISWFDTTNNFPKWTIYDNEGNKLIVDVQLELPVAGVQEIVATTLSDNKVVVAYSTSTGGKVQAFDLSGLVPALTPVFTTVWSNNAVTNIAITALVNSFVIGGNTGTGGIIVYLNNNGTYKLGSPSPDLNQSTRTFTIQQLVSLNLKQTINSELFICYRANKLTLPTDFRGYTTVWDDAGAQVVANTVITSDPLNFIKTTNTLNGNILVAYRKADPPTADGTGYFKIFSPSSSLYKKERSFYNASSFSELTINLLSTGNLIFNLVIPNRGYSQNWSYLGNISSLSLANKLQIASTGAGAAWDDNVDNYADTSDHGHYFKMGTEVYEFDNYAEANRNLGINFVGERNRFNTFYHSSPEDDVIDLIQETLQFAFTLLIGVPEQPADRVDDIGFYIRRNSYISRNQSQQSPGNSFKGYYVRKQDYSETLRQDVFRINKEINWPEWKKDGATYDEWSSWALAVDYLETIVATPTYITSGRAILKGFPKYGLYKDFVAPIPTGTAIFHGAAKTGPAKDYIAPTPTGEAVFSGSAITRAFYIYYAPEPTGGAVFSGSAVVSYTFNYRYVASGKATLSGYVVADERGYVFNPAGTTAIILGGSANTLGDMAYEASGVAVFAGVADTEIGYTNYIYVPTSGMLFNGAADTTIELDRTSSGGTLFVGAAGRILEIARSMAGGAIFAGAADTAVEVITNYIPTGGAILQGASAYQDFGLGFEYIPSGGMIITGEAITLDGLTSYQGIGGAVFAGVADRDIEFARNMNGVALMGGVADTSSP